MRETKYFYDNKLVGLTKGDLTKQEEWLNDETVWNQSSLFILPSDSSAYFVDSTGADKGLRLEDINSDGFPS